MIHSMVEFPLWNTHFLGVTALLMGLATRPGTSSRTASRLTYAAAAGTCVALTLAMAMLLKDYVRLNATSSIETPLTRTGAAAAARDAAVMRSLRRPARAGGRVLDHPGGLIGSRDLPERLKMSERATRYFPSITASYCAHRPYFSPSTARQPRRVNCSRRRCTHFPSGVRRPSGY